ncbi:hypothetical protein F4604DRAFT_1935122 [Suillus subluteus]|nr:hypothetical protein F4604DRAFT_1935122 [Suillus subluteus]
MPNGSNIPGRLSDGTFKECIDKFLCDGPATGTNVTALGLMYCRAEPTTQATLDIEPCVFMHTCTSIEEDDSDDKELAHLEREVTQAHDAFAAVKVDHTNCKDKGKNIQFEGVNVPPHPKTGPSSKTTDVVEEVASLQVKASGLKTTSTLTSSSSSLPATSSSSYDPPTANPSSMQFRYTHLLEDKEANKKVINQMLDSSISIPMRELIAVSTDIHKVLKEMTTTKHVTVGKYNGCLQRSDVGHIVTEHLELLQCIRAVTSHGQVLSHVLDQGAKCIIMPRSVWQSLGGIPLRSDHKLVMELVNTSTDKMLGVIDNLLLDFGMGEMLFQVQVVLTANFKILLGRPFFMLTSCHTEDLSNREQDITLTNPNSGKVIRIPTNHWVKRCPECEKGSHPPPSNHKKGFDD